ncbi:hypothetical protein MNBD_GAMMA10-3130 [hydrothermal vent metagenome]|uniref:ParD protein (Antitoxin to ParE) n=1 Tax=hydrothermal vent metagenome TaxID=652676 RepID=A0A3B0YN96_9ZZZZ
MSNSINLSLTDELREYLDSNTGDGTLYAAPSEFLRSLLREKEEKQASAALRHAIISGYQDAIAGRVYRFSGDLRKDMAAFQEKNKE